MEPEGKSFWQRKDILSRLQSLKWFKKKFLAGDEKAIHQYWMHQSYIIYWRCATPGGFLVGRFIARRQKRMKSIRPPRIPRLPKVKAPVQPIIWQPQMELDWS